jgi:asparagine synthase (glutamine-hydrolysing)
MASRLAHRGPDEEGFYIAQGIGLGHRRLSIIDLSGGKQPMGNEDGTVWVVFNGEIFNYNELREMLEKKGHRFRTRSDTETIVHCYEEFGPDFCTHLNGQFAIALWDGNRRRLVLSRDRVGIRPLYYSRAPDGGMVFGSEMKALFAYPGITPRLDPAGLDQVFSLWATLPPRTVFKGIHEVPSGSVMVLDHNGTHTEKYWKLTFPRQGEYEYRSPEYYARELSESIHDSVKLRLRADVTVASYLSGGIDSSIIASLVKKHHNRDLITFSVCFADGQFDERQYQQMMVEQLNTDHRRIEITCDNIAQGYASVVRHAEMPMMRTAPAPLFQLSRLVRDNGIKVVLTGEGADEIFAGYNIFKEDRIRRFWARQPTSSFRPLLLSRIYPYVKNQGGAFWQAFFRNGLEDIDNPYYSHQIRWNNTAHIKRLLGNHVRADMNETANVTEPLSEHVDPEILSWHPLCRAQYLETCIFMSGYLLSAQGDRMMMGNSVEGRFPFLDHRVIELAARIPPEYKLKGLNEKHILKEAFKADLPEGVLNRSKQPYRAPISSCFINGGSGMAARVLEPDALTAGECFDPGRVSMLLKRLRASPVDRISARDDMAVAALVSTQLLTHHFISPLVEA